MPQFDYQQLCHFVLPEQGGLSVETILKRFLHLTPREIRHAKYIPDGIQKNGVSCRTNAVVQTGDTITFRYEQKCPHLSEDQVLPVSGDSAGVRILYEDSDLCVADKPSGMVCHASHGHYSDSLTHAAASLLKTPTAPSELRCIGRLDKDTSGLVLFAKNQLAAARLSRQRESGALKKEYLALVHHPFPKKRKKKPFVFPWSKFQEMTLILSIRLGNVSLKCVSVKKGTACGLLHTTRLSFRILSGPSCAAVWKPAARIRSAFTWHLLDIHFSEIRSTESATAVPVPRSMPGNCTFCSR